MHTKLESRLRTKGFVNDSSRGAPICRWLYQGIKVDVMPTNENILGFNNQWYPGGVDNKISQTLPNGTEIYVFPLAYYLASKFEAHHNRGGRDLRQSHDFEDIIYVFDNCTDITKEIKNADQIVKNFLRSECGNLLKNEGLAEAIESALPLNSDSERVEIIESLIKEISEMI